MVRSSAESYARRSAVELTYSWNYLRYSYICSWTIGCRELLIPPASSSWFRFCINWLLTICSRSIRAWISASRLALCSYICYIMALIVADCRSSISAIYCLSSSWSCGLPDSWMTSSSIVASCLEFSSSGMTAIVGALVFLLASLLVICLGTVLLFLFIDTEARC